MTSSLPSNTKKFNIDQFYNRKIDSSTNFKTEDIDAVIGYFQKRGFDEIAAINTGGVLLRQSYQDKLPVFELIDTLRGLSDVQLSRLVAQILNINRGKSSAIGYRIPDRKNLFDQRNILV